MSDMTKRILMICALALAIVPAALAVSPDASKNASGACTALKAQMGTSFTSAYATFGACVSKYAQLEQQNVTSANTSCTALQADTTFAASHGGKTFDQFYGTGKSGKNAFGNCVSAHAKASSQAEQQGRQNPSRSCRGQRSANSAAFAQTYGKNANDRNAFGKCVSQVASKQAQNELNAAGACKADQTSNAATFASTYGTNENAFGKCVSTKASATSAAQQQATISAQKACLTELKAGATAFHTKYASFGRCVSKLASA
jgi:hypothetical protein